MCPSLSLEEAVTGERAKLLHWSTDVVKEII